MDLGITSSTRAVIIAVFTIYIAVLFIYAFYSRRSMKKTKIDQYVSEFYTAGRGMGVFMIAMMVAAGVCGAGVFLGIPGYIYTYGSAWLVCCFCGLTMNLMVLGTVGKKTGIVARRIDAQSFVSLLMHRFNNNKIFGFLVSITILLFLGGFAVSTIIGGGRIFEVMTGLPYWIGLALFMLLVVIAAISGGISGVATAIVIQGIVMTIATLTLFILGINAAGPLPEVIPRLAETYPEWFDIVMSPQMVFSYFVLFGYTTFTLPHVTMSALTYKNSKVLHSAIKVGLVVVFIWYMCLNLLAFPIKAMFPDLTVPDMGIPLLTVSVLPPWVAGLVLAGVCSAVQSSLGGMIIALSSCFVKDVYQTLFRPNASPETLKKLTRGSVVVISALIFVFALRPPSLLATIIVYSTGGLTAGLTSIMLLGYYWKRCNEWGGIAGLISGVVFYILIASGILPWSLDMQACVMGIVISTIFTVVVSLLTPKSPYGIIQVWFGKTYPEASTKLTISSTGE